jgi:hypothetical protein
VAATAPRPNAKASTRNISAWRALFGGIYSNHVALRASRIPAWLGPEPQAKPAGSSSAQAVRER